MEWFQEYADVSEARRGASPETRFAAFSLTETSGEAINKEIAKVQAETVQEEEEKKE